MAHAEHKQEISGHRRRVRRHAPRPSGRDRAHGGDRATVRRVLGGGAVRPAPRHGAPVRRRARRHGRAGGHARPAGAHRRERSHPHDARHGRRPCARRALHDGVRREILPFLPRTDGRQARHARARAWLRRGDGQGSRRRREGDREPRRRDRRVRAGGCGRRRPWHRAHPGRRAAAHAERMGRAGRSVRRHDQGRTARVDQEAPDQAAPHLELHERALPALAGPHRRRQRDSRPPSRGGGRRGARRGARPHDRIPDRESGRRLDRRLSAGGRRVRGLAGRYGTGRDGDGRRRRWFRCCRRRR
ncbi:hypothetical protein BBIA_2588 [Bifidobacterium biavatii DSM 23969]|uniref:Uncharacterized protein n=1 Tax=Bifidobacterium biavatii DSM 23969 TaxID=1437608 RepID=A0A086Z659_9BIFI|nr:hypothetical protein BBIA_2588 [Bifidobacterium biavatii DSM 23969]